MTNERISLDTMTQKQFEFLCGKMNKRIREKVEAENAEKNYTNKQFLLRYLDFDLSLVFWGLNLLEILEA